MEPAGYVNANVALRFMAFWPAVVLAGAVTFIRSCAACSWFRLPALRPCAARPEPRLAARAPLVASLALAFVPGRARLLVVLAIVAIVTAAIAAPVLDVYDASAPDGDLDAALSTATRAICGRRRS